MAFLGGKDLARKLTRNSIIIDDDGLNNYLPSRIKQCSYELNLGNRVYLTDNESKISTILDDTNDSININPGQFALLMTEETIHIPNDLLGFISIKATEKLKGLINVSGFHVDPGFKGKLLFSVYNASPSTIQLRKGDQYFLIWFSELKTPLEKEYLYKSNNHQGQNKIDPKYITPLINSEAILPFDLGKKIKENSQELDKIKHSKALSAKNIITIVSIAITLLIALNVGFWINTADYNKGYNDGLKHSEINLYKDRLDKLEKNMLSLTDTLSSKNSSNKNVK